MPYQPNNSDRLANLANQRREHPSTYVVQDRSNADEMARLHLQDQILTTGMGGVLPEQADPSLFTSIIDVGCGTGSWLIEVAKTHPTVKRLAGVDISGKMLDYAREQADQAGVSDRVTFQMMDALRLLEFPEGSFDLVNQRLGASWLRTWDWPGLLAEYQRILYPGGCVRITESEIVLDSSSPALNRLSELALAAGFQAGLYFTPAANGVTSQLEGLLTRHGFLQVQSHQHRLEFRGGSVQGQRWASDLAKAFRTMQPFLRKWTRVPDDYEDIYQRMVSEMQQEDFVAHWSLRTVWGVREE